MLSVLGSEPLFHKAGRSIFAPRSLLTSPCLGLFRPHPAPCSCHALSAVLPSATLKQDKDQFILYHIRSVLHGIFILCNAQHGDGAVGKGLWSSKFGKHCLKALPLEDLS